MRILLFDWTAGGHHAIYVRRVAEALRPHATVSAAVPTPSTTELRLAVDEVVPLGAPRPSLDFSQPLAAQHEALAHAELDRLEAAVVAAAPDHVVHLYADPVIRRLVERPMLPAATTLCLFFPRAHYPRVYDSHLSPKERGRAWFLEALVARWRRRRDAHALFTLDEEAARRWSRRGGAPAHWLPEPPVPPIARPPAARTGCVLYGSLAQRKGVDLLAAAVRAHGSGVDVVLAGAVEPRFESGLDGAVRMMQAGGAAVTLRDRLHSEADGLAALSRARCAVLPYPRHFGMSRVLLEACVAGTPVLVHDHGLLAHLVRRHGLGIVVDCTDPDRFGRALRSMVDDADAPQRYTGALAAFAHRYRAEAFQRAVLAPFAHAPAAARSGTACGGGRRPARPRATR